MITTVRGTGGRWIYVAAEVYLHTPGDGVSLQTIRHDLCALVWWPFLRKANLWTSNHKISTVGLVAKDTKNFILWAAVMIAERHMGRHYTLTSIKSLTISRYAGSEVMERGGVGRWGGNRRFNAPSISVRLRFLVWVAFRKQKLNVYERKAWPESQCHDSIMN